MENQTQTPGRFSLWEDGMLSTTLDLPMALGANCFNVAKRESAIEVVQYVAMQFPDKFRRIAATPSDFFYHLSFTSDIQKAKLVFNGMVALAKACQQHELQWEDVVITPVTPEASPAQASTELQPAAISNQKQDNSKGRLQQLVRSFRQSVVGAILWCRSNL